MVKALLLRDIFYICNSLIIKTCSYPVGDVHIYFREMFIFFGEMFISVLFFLFNFVVQ